MDPRDANDENGEEDEVLEPLDQQSDGHLYLITGDNRSSLPIVTIFEEAMIISMRTSQIDAGGEYFTDATGLEKASHIAGKEYNDGKIPLLIYRPVGSVNNNGAQYYEVWDPNEMLRDTVDIGLLPE
jgi:DNA-directed RNA polymerase subunit K/omega